MADLVIKKMINLYIDAGDIGFSKSHQADITTEIEQVKITLKSNEKLTAPLTKGLILQLKYAVNEIVLEDAHDETVTLNKGDKITQGNIEAYVFETVNLSTNNTIKFLKIMMKMEDFLHRAILVHRGVILLVQLK